MVKVEYNPLTGGEKGLIPREEPTSNIEDKRIIDIRYKLQELLVKTLRGNDQKERAQKQKLTDFLSKLEQDIEQLKQEIDQLGK